LDLSYKRAFDVQGGVLVEAGYQHGPNNEQVFPFVTMAVDPLKMANEESRSSLRLFGSYARRTVGTIVGYTMADLDNGPVMSGVPGGFQAQNNNFGFGTIGVLGGGGFIPAVVHVPKFGVGQLGLSLSTWNDRGVVLKILDRFLN